ncbi:MAG: xylose isomerase, partial [Acidimicrobiales bacterium]
MTDFFDNVPKAVRPAGAEGPADELSYRVYDPDRLVAGKRMEDHLRIAVCYWHSFNWPGSDIFGAGTFDRPWLETGADPMDAAFAKQDAAFEFF